MFGWLTRWFRNDDPTLDWPEPRPATLTLDLGRQTLNGVRIGEPAERLRLFGRPRFSRNGDYQYFDYPTLGVQCVADAKGIVSFGVAIENVEPSIPPAQSLVVQMNGGGMTVRRGGRLAELSRSLGVKPTEDRDEDEINATFSAGSCDCAIECGADGSIRWVELTQS